MLRSIGAFLDQRGMREVLFLEAPDGFIVQGVVVRAGSGSWSETVGQVHKETLTFLDEDVARFMEEAAARRGWSGTHPRTKAGPYETGAPRARAVLDEQKPRDVFFFEQGGAFVIRMLTGSSRHRGRSTPWPSSPPRTSTQMIAQGPALRDPGPNKAKPAGA